MRALSLNCSVARGNQCGGGEGLTSSPICSITKILFQRLAKDKSIMDAKQKIHNIKQTTKNNNFERSEGAKEDLHQGKWQLVNKVIS